MPTFSNAVVVYGLLNYHYPKAGASLMAPLNTLLSDDDDDPRRNVALPTSR